MAWRRRKAGRKRKADTARYPSGGVRHERVTPTDELMAKRRARFGDATQVETDWVIDRLWGQGLLDDRAREAAQRLNGLMRGRLARSQAPMVALSKFHDGRGMAPGPADDEATLDAEYVAAIAVLRHAGRLAQNAVLNAACFQGGVDPRTVDAAALRIGLAALAAHFARPQHRRLMWAVRLLTGAENAPTHEMHGGAICPDDAHH